MSQRNEEIKEAMTSYAERLQMVRRLSAPSLEEVESADDLDDSNYNLRNNAQ